MAGISVATRLEAVREKIIRACQRARRDINSVSLVAVSKRQPIEKVLEAVRAGQTIFGENYVQEALEKSQQVPQGNWHLIGPLQSNKAKLVVGKFSLLHAVDRWSVIEELSKRASHANVHQNFLLEVNISEEPTKAGFLSRYVAEIGERAETLPNISVQGLMAMPPLSQDPEASRPYFVNLRRLAERMKWAHLSMGSSQDYEVAIEEGATLIRVGTEIFGPRER